MRNRVIKFRIWDERSQEMRYGYPVIRKGKLESFVEDRTGSQFGIDWWPFTLMQYTGIKDKNGKEIWEGDIVKATYHWSQFQILTQVVKYSENGYFHPFGIDDDAFEPKYVVVIGNIYENPELLKKADSNS